MFILFFHRDSRFGVVFSESVGTFAPHRASTQIGDTYSELAVIETQTEFEAGYEASTINYSTEGEAVVLDEPLADSGMLAAILKAIERTESKVDAVRGEVAVMRREMTAISKAMWTATSQNSRFGENLDVIIDKMGSVEKVALSGNIHAIDMFPLISKAQLDDMRSNLEKEEYRMAVVRKLVLIKR